MNDHEPPARAAFIVSLPRTGSTLLRLLLDTHPEIWAPDELELGALARALFYTAEGLTEAAGRSSADDMALEQSPAALELTRRTLDRLLGEPLRAKGKRLWCEKSPHNLDHLEILERLYPQARWIALHRHPLDTLASWLDSNRYGIVLDGVWPAIERSPKNFLFAMLRTWLDGSARLLAHEERWGEACLRLRYEDLVSRPSDAASRVFDFLGVMPAEQVVGGMFSAGHHQRASYGGDLNAFLSRSITTTRAGRGNDLPWRKLRALPVALREELASVVARLGYPAIDFERGGYELGLETAPVEPGPPALSVPLGSLLERAVAGWPPEAASTGRRLSLLVRGDGGGEWTLDFTTDEAGLRQGSAGTEGQIELTAADLRSLIAGGANAGVLFRAGKIRVAGEVDLALVRRLLDRLSAWAETAP